jgi:hypothetical protein
LSIIEEGMPMYIPGTKMINLRKCVKVSEIINDVLQYQEIAYQFYPINQISQLLLSTFNDTIHDEVEMVRLANKLEPPNAVHVE